MSVLAGLQQLAEPDLVERAREEWHALDHMAYHGSNSGVWYADLTKESIQEIRALLRDLGHALAAFPALLAVAEAAEFVLAHGLLSTKNEQRLAAALACLAVGEAAE